MASPEKRKIPLSYAEILEKIRSYCAYQERCHSEVKGKLLEQGVPYSLVLEITSQLITEGFLNEERFARAFAGGKFRTRKWGRRKIERELKRRGISEYCIGKALSEIEPDLYQQTFCELFDKKWKEKKGLKTSGVKASLLRYLMAKGFEPEIIYTRIHELLDG